MEADLVDTPSTMKEAVCFSNITTDVGFGTHFVNVPLYIDETSTLHVDGNQTFNPLVKHVSL